jgi:hypothetical protein
MASVEHKYMGSFARKHYAEGFAKGLARAGQARGMIRGMRRGLLIARRTRCSSRG